MRNKTLNPNFFSKYKSWENFIKIIDVFLTLTGKLGFFFGVLATFFYCIQIRFIPSGLSLTDSIVFVFSILAVGLILLLGPTYVAFSVHWVFALIDDIFFKKSYLITRRRIRRILRFTAKHPQDELPFNSKLPNWAQTKILFFISLFIFLTFFISIPLKIISLYLNNKDYLHVLYFVSGIGLAGYILYILVLSLNKLNWKQFLALTTLIPIVALVFSQGTLISVGMRLIGIRHERLALEISRPNLIKIQSIADAYNFKIKTCSLNSLDHELLLEANILWTGLGSKTLLELKESKDNKSENRIAVEIDSTGIWPVRGDSEPKCAKIAK